MEEKRKEERKPEGFQGKITSARVEGAGRGDELR